MVIGLETGQVEMGEAYVRSFSSVPVLVVGRVLIRNKKSHDLARSGISGLDARSIYASLLVTMKHEL
ncbi:hypothetical protein U9M48_029012 [Paspalum notatum var. saurae]|uniref:Uncharacterized protein n=1 Tax=Paspalum notatum var. saurae TaxID=547442 RepID=A0AAQ3TWK0_PASNO